MAKLSQYSPRQRTILQIVMWLLLGATVGMAAMVTQYRRGKYEVTLASPIRCGPFAVQLPKDWKRRTQFDQRSVLVAQATEPKRAQSNKPARQFAVYYEKLDQPVDPVTYLLNQQVLGFTGTQAVDAESEDPDPKVLGKAQERTIAGYPGVVVWRRVLPRFALFTGGQAMTQIYAATVSPEGDALVLMYLCDVSPTPADQSLIRQVMDSIVAVK